jgi:hypothetical protein
LLLLLVFVYDAFDEHVDPCRRHRRCHRCY